MSNTKSVLGGGNYRELEESECSERVEATGADLRKDTKAKTIVWSLSWYGRREKNQQRNFIKLMIERGGEWKGGKDIFTSLLFHFLVHSHMTFVMIFWSFFSFFYFPTLAWSQRGDYLWGQHRIREKQGSSGDFAKNDHNNDVDDNDDSELMLVVSH